MYTIVYKTSVRAKSLRVSVKANGACVVTMPERLPRIIAERFVAEKQAWIEAAQEKMRKKEEGRVRLAVPSFAAAKAEALRFTTQRVAEINRAYGFSYTGVAVRNQKTRWGSCSRRGKLSFNYRIVYLPPHLADYLMVHELCHLAVFNHSPKFWALVAQTIPAYRELRRELKAIAW